jgi:peptidoglycan/xylan/chitin deacetylase (PgdA/CDA1 family)
MMHLDQLSMKAFNFSLWCNNHPRQFWQCQPDFSDQVWEMAIAQSMFVLGLPETTSIDKALELTLGEGQFGTNRYQLGLFHRAYYQFKPLIPRMLTRFLRRMYSRFNRKEFLLDWPIERRFPQFLWETLRRVILLTGKQNLRIRSFWPEGKRFAVVLTHDIESDHGQKFVARIADLEESFGFRSSFNFVSDLYRIDKTLITDLQQRGFEIGVHGWKHDGKLFASQILFRQSVRQINASLSKFEAVGFRSPLTLRQPEWMQELNIEYDLSFFDTDPFEPMPGGTMSIWPFFLGHFVELPYTLVQDYTLTTILAETSPRIWLEKVDFLQAHRGMALINTHPDYLRKRVTLDIYREFLQNIKERQKSWNALPREVAAWWRSRASDSLLFSNDNLMVVKMIDGRLEFEQTAGPALETATQQIAVEK